MTILTCFQGSAGVITFNRPHRYNATDLETICQIAEFLKEARQNNSVKKIILTSDHPKAFCAGGDIRALYDSGRNKTSFAYQFFWDE